MSDIYVVLGINLIVWAGVFGYLIHLQSKVKEVTQLLKQKETSNQEN